MKYLMKFNESINNFIPIPKDSEDFLIYYKIHSNKSMEKFDIALDKLDIKDDVYFHYFFVIDTLIKKVKKTDIVYLCIDTTYSHKILNNLDEIKEQIFRFNDFVFGGDVYVEDYEVTSKKYNL